ncbi:facilitated trehalose transporter Tret1-like [Colias croceus]|uniref:facilitated trehalose transporter Tret1-like n=1 Tax=Colias crocea TaxID=72248 RepID=UPI001E28091C|nr:facilitated trehalose transporter Tret1-like [Colias croceus]
MTVKTNSGHTYWQWIYSIIASMGFMIYGLEAAWISPITKKLQAADSPLGAPLTNQEISLLASINCLSSALVVPIFALLTDRYGRKWIVFSVTIPAIFSILLRIMLPNLIALSIARAAAGMSASGAFAVTTVYIRELSQNNLIGVLGSVSVLLQNLGFLIMYLIGAYFDYFTVLWIYLAFPLAMGVLMLKAPESPSFLVKRGKIDEAYRAVAFLRGLKTDDKEVKTEIEYMQNQQEAFRNLPTVDLKAIFKDKAWRRGLLFMLSVFTIHAWNGAFAIITYASAILESTGNNFGISPELQPLSFPIVMIIASFTFTSIAEKFDRKPLLIGAYLISAIALAGLGIALLIQSYGYTIPGWLPITCMMIAVALYAGGVRSLPYIMTTEMFNFQARAKVMGCIGTYTWLTVATQLYAYAPLTDTFGIHTTFIFFGFLNVLGALITCLIPETRGKTDEMIRDELANGKKK